MPEISRFYGITIQMYFTNSEHNPPHFHASYGQYVAAIDILTGHTLDGFLPSKKLKLINEWLDLHRDELIKFWETQDFKKIPPLK